MKFNINAALPALATTALGTNQGFFIREAFEAGEEVEKVWEAALKRLRGNNPSLSSCTALELIDALARGSGDLAGDWLHLLAQPLISKRPHAENYAAPHTTISVLAGILRAAQGLDDSQNQVISDLTVIFELLIDSRNHTLTRQAMKRACPGNLTSDILWDIRHDYNVAEALGTYPAEIMRLWEVDAYPSIELVVKEAEGFIKRCPNELRPAREQLLAAMLQKVEAKRSKILSPDPSRLGQTVLEKIAYALIDSGTVMQGAINAVAARYQKKL